MQLLRIMQYSLIIFLVAYCVHNFMHLVMKIFAFIAFLCKSSVVHNHRTLGKAKDTWKENSTHYLLKSRLTSM
uniref:Putative secreted protein n=1 Tax=Ixodes ricinus TaxID=34613 RepID=A0A6B0TSP4_IXORI